MGVINILVALYAMKFHEDTHGQSLERKQWTNEMSLKNFKGRASFQLAHPLEIFPYSEMPCMLDHREYLRKATMMCNRFSQYSLAYAELTLAHTRVTSIPRRQNV